MYVCRFGPQEKLILLLSAEPRIEEAVDVLLNSGLHTDAIILLRVRYKQYIESLEPQFINVESSILQNNVLQPFHGMRCHLVAQARLDNIFHHWGVSLESKGLHDQVTLRSTILCF